MSVDAILDAIRALTPDERAELDARLESEAAPEPLPELTPELKAELERRVANAKANPGAGYTRISAEARDDIDGACAWYEGFDAGHGDRFLTELYETLTAVRADPNLYGYVSPSVRALRSSPRCITFCISSSMRNP
jgi:putative addiction module component (TIGR02574 family)